MKKLLDFVEKKPFAGVRKVAVVALWVALAGSLLSCGKFTDSDTSYDCKDELYSYNTGVKSFFLDHYSFRSDCIFIGFNSHAQTTEIMNFIKETGLFEPVDPKSNHRVLRMEGVSYLFVYTKRRKPCYQLKDIINKLEMVDIVSYAHLAFCSRHDNCKSIFSFSGFFRVTLKDKDDFTDLNDLALETNTRIIRQSRHNPDEFILEANKYSKGNAMQMANYFFETGKFAATMLDFWSDERINEAGNPYI